MYQVFTRRVSARLLAAAALMIPAAMFAQPRRVVLQGVIDQPGSYSLPNDLSVSRGAAILITASGVDLDLSGSNIVGPGGVQAVGIHVRGAAGVSIRNGKFANLAMGIIVENSANVSIRDCHFRGEGIAPASGPPETAVMIMQSRNVVVENNAVYNTGLGFFVRGGRSSGNRIANNTLTAAPGVFAAIGICYNPTATDTQGPKGDLIVGNLITGYPNSIQMNSTSAANVIKDNILVFSGESLTTPTTNMDMNNVKVKQ